MISNIIIHHSASPKETTTARQINKWHRKRNWGTFLKPIYLTKKSSYAFWVQYQYVIEANGAVIQCRKEDEIGWHTGGDWNAKSIGICLCGNFEIEDTNNEQIFALRDLLRKLCGKYNIPAVNILGHRDTKSTLCPGKNIDIQFVRSLIEEKKTEKEYTKSKILMLLKSLIENIQNI